jgi:Cu-Zn family superoxide dismutase
MKLFAILAAATTAFTVDDFNGQPTGGLRPCEFYTMKATANFGNGYTENVPSALFGGSGLVTGTITFEQNACGGPVTITGTLDGLAAGTHGWHIHTLGNAQQGCGGAFTGGHFNPFTTGIAAEDAGRKKREVGQIGNVQCDESGVCAVDDTDQLIKLHGLRNIMGRSLVVHLNEDQGAAGMSGSRVACASIVMSEDNTPQ